MAPAHAAHVCAGHFPDDPLLPGSALVALMAAAARLVLPDAAIVDGIERATFRERVAPSDPIVVVAHARTRARVDAVVRVCERDAAVGALRVRLPS